MGVSEESISKFLIGNRFHVKLRILSPENCKESLRVKSWKAEVTAEIFTWNRYPIKNLLMDSLLTPIVESTYLNRDTCKFESSQKDESRWQSTDSTKAYRNTSAFKCRQYELCHLNLFGQNLKVGGPTQPPVLLDSLFVLFQVKRGTICQFTVVHFDFCSISNIFSCCYACITLE